MRHMISKALLIACLSIPVNIISVALLSASISADDFLVLLQPIFRFFPSGFNEGPPLLFAIGVVLSCFIVLVSASLVSGLTYLISHSIQYAALTFGCALVIQALLSLFNWLQIITASQDVARDQVAQVSQVAQRATERPVVAELLILGPARFEIKDLLNEQVDPHFVNEGYEAFATGEIVIPVKISRAGKYYFYFDIISSPTRSRARGEAGMLAPLRDSIRLEVVRELKPGEEHLAFPLSVAEISRKRGLLWAWVKDGSISMSMQVAIAMTLKEYHEMTGYNANDAMARLPQELQNQLRRVDPGKESKRFVTRSRADFSGSLVVRTLTR